MILTGSEIVAEYRRGRITIDPFDERHVNPNSYNYHLSDLIRLPNGEADSQSASVIAIPTSGIVLQPKRLYLAATSERVGSDTFVTTLIGCSSMGRLGLFLELAADLGHTGDAHQWTLELVCVQSLRIYPGMRVGQLCFWEPSGAISMYRSGYTAFNHPAVNIRDIRVE
jgi:dCTP deaminase